MVSFISRLFFLDLDLALCYFGRLDCLGQDSCQFTINFSIPLIIWGLPPTLTYIGHFDLVYNCAIESWIRSRKILQILEHFDEFISAGFIALSIACHAALLELLVA